MDERSLLGAQGVFYVATGLWPIVSLKSFEAVTGPKADGWLVKTTGGLIAVVGAVLVSASLRREPPREVVLLGKLGAAVLGFASGWYSLKGRIAKVYLLDAATEAAIVAAYGAQRTIVPS
jgi:hypothetical protein